MNILGGCPGRIGRKGLALVVTTMLHGSARAEEKSVSVVIDSVLRAQPRQNAPDQAVLKRGDQLRLLQLRDGWALVEAGQRRFWARVVSGPMNFQPEATGDAQGALVTARDDARLLVRPGRRSRSDVLVTVDTEMRVLAQSDDARWVLCETRYGDVGWIAPDDVRRADDNLDEGDAAVVTEAGFARRRADRIASRAMELGAGELVTVEVRTDRWALLENREGVRGWYPLARLAKRSSASFTAAVSDNRIGTRIQVERDSDLLRDAAPGENPTFQLEEGKRATVSATRANWLFVVDGEGRWGWIRESATRPAPIGSATVMIEANRTAEAKSASVGASLSATMFVTLPVADQNDPLYAILLTATGNRSFGSIRVDLLAKATIARFLATQMEQKLATESLGGEFTGSVTYEFAPAFSVGPLVGYAANVDSALGGTSLADSQNGAFGGALVRSRLSSWLSLVGSGTVIRTKKLDGKSSSTRAEELLIKVRASSRLGLIGGLRFTQFDAGKSSDYSLISSFVLFDHVAVGSMLRMLDTGKGPVKTASVFLDFSL